MADGRDGSDTCECNEVHCSSTQREGEASRAMAAEDGIYTARCKTTPTTMQPPLAYLVVPHSNGVSPVRRRHVHTDLFSTPNVNRAVISKGERRTIEAS